MTLNDFPRRCYTDKWHAAEKAINDAIEAVEDCGAHTFLTDAVILLDEAQRKVADWVDRPMQTRVVNLYKEPYDVYIGRPGKGKDGYFGNPIVPNETCPVCEKVHAEKGTTLPCYKVYLEARVAADGTFRTRLGNLKGRVLGCFCKPKACHGDIIVEYLDG